MTLLRLKNCLLIFLFILTGCFEKSQSQKPIRIGYPISGAIINSQVGLYLEEKSNSTLPLELHRFNTGRELKVALAAGQVDVILTSEANFLVLLGEDFPAVAISSLGSAGKMALVVKTDSSIKKIEDLAGKKIATLFGTSIHQPAVEWTMALSPPPLIMNISQPSALRAALQAGEVAAIVDWDPYLTEEVLKHQVRVLKETRFDLITVSSRKFVDDHQQQVKLLNETFKTALWQISQNPNSINQIWATVSQMSPEVISQASSANENYSAKKIEDINIQISPAMKAKLQKLADFLFKEKILKKPVDLPTAYWDQTPP
jgi:ABC-type nitrate/sulfonate/bicarbonate transport system substrate-binding protein